MDTHYNEHRNDNDDIMSEDNSITEDASESMDRKRHPCAFDEGF